MFDDIQDPKEFEGDSGVEAIEIRFLLTSEEFSEGIFYVNKHQIEYDNGRR